MQIFHKLLTRFISQKNTTIYTLAKNTGIERSYIQKMKSGARIPTDKNIILKIAKGLMLTNNETSELIEAYFIAKMGEGKYFQRLFVKNIIKSFEDLPTNNNLILESCTQNKLVMQSDYEHISGISAVHKLVKAVMEIEASKEQGHIKILAQPNFTYVYNCISILGNNTKVDNIIFFYNQEDDNAINYNLDVFYKLMPLFFSCENFHPYYIHDHVDTIYNDTAVLPIIIITSEYVLRIANDFKQALISKDLQMLKVFSNSFEKKMLNAKPIFDTISTEPQKYFADTNTLMDFDTESNYSIMYQPCITPYIPTETIKTIINLQMLTPKLTEQINEYLHNLNTWHNSCMMVFTEEGLELFLRSGKIIEIPACMIQGSLSKKQRLEVVASFIKEIEEGHVIIHIAKATSMKVPQSIIITAYSKQYIVIHYFDKSGNIRIFRLEEISLVNSFHDFLVWVQDCDMVYSQEQSLEIIKNIYNKHFNNVYK